MTIDMSDGADCGSAVSEIAVEKNFRKKAGNFSKNISVQNHSEYSGQSSAESPGQSSVESPGQNPESPPDNSLTPNTRPDTSSHVVSTEVIHDTRSDTTQGDNNCSSTVATTAKCNADGVIFSSNVSIPGDHAAFTADDVRTFIDRESTRRQSNKVLHGHPSPMYWKPFEQPLSNYLEKRLECSTENDLEVNLYVGTPFCLKTKPSRCGFCLFPSEDYAGNKGVEEYIGYLAREFELYKPYYQNDKLSSLYFGGGTPNLYHPEHYGQVMGLVDKLYDGVPDDIEKTLEGIPQLFNEDKLRAIKEAGFNRVSMGVQQLNDELIKYSGRKQTRQQVFNALEHCQRFDLASSIDLIYGWPEQTINDMLEDLKIAVGSGVDHLTHYELNVAGRSDFASKKKRDLLPSIQTNIEMYHIAKDFLIAQGFEQVTVYDWRRKPELSKDERYGRYDYEHNLHKFVDHDGAKVTATQQMCGIGFAAVNFHVNSADDPDANWVYMNHHTLKGYVESLDKNEFPVARGFAYNQRDVRLVWLFQTMQTMRINHSNYRKIFNEDLLQSYSAIWAELDKRRWIRTTDTEIIFEGDGQYYIPMLQSLVASKRLEQIRAERQGSDSSAALKSIDVVVA